MKMKGSHLHGLTHQCVTELLVSQELFVIELFKLLMCQCSPLKSVLWIHVWMDESAFRTLCCASTLVFSPVLHLYIKWTYLFLLSSSFDWQWKWWESSCRAVCPLFSLCLPGPKESGWVPSQWTQQGWRWCKMWRWQRKRSRGLLF